MTGARRTMCTIRMSPGWRHDPRMHLSGCPICGGHFCSTASRKGDCWDNAVAESFFASLKKERVHWRHYQTRTEAQQDILDYIAMFYNSRRLHSALDYRSPNDFGSAMTKLKKAA